MKKTSKIFQYILRIDKWYLIFIISKQFTHINDTPGHVTGKYIYVTNDIQRCPLHLKHVHSDL